VGIIEIAVGTLSKEYLGVRAGKCQIPDTESFQWMNVIPEPIWGDLRAFYLRSRVDNSRRIVKQESGDHYVTPTN
jgi:hypothetical protein